MKAKTFYVILVVLLLFALAACQQLFTRNFGGNMTETLPDDTKLVMATWKESNLWYLTRPMLSTDEAQTYTFKESSLYGVLEGKVTIIERKSK